MGDLFYYPNRGQFCCSEKDNPDYWTIIIGY